MQQIGDIANKHGQNEKPLAINAIPNDMEKYMAFMLGNHLTFIDSFQFMSSSLDRLISNLQKDDLKYTSKSFKGKMLDLLSKKGVYTHMTTWIALKSSMRRNYQLRISSTAS